MCCYSMQNVIIALLHYTLDPNIVFLLHYIILTTLAIHYFPDIIYTTTKYTLTTLACLSYLKKITYIFFFFSTGLLV